MSYGVTTHVAAPIEAYDAVHAAFLAQGVTQTDGLLLHIGRPTADGFETVEVWESRQHYDRYNSEVIGPLIAETSAAEGTPSLSSPQVEEFEVRGLVIPRGDITF